MTLILMIDTSQDDLTGLNSSLCRGGFARRDCQWCIKSPSVVRPVCPQWTRIQCFPRFSTMSLTIPPHDSDMIQYQTCGTSTHFQNDIYVPAPINVVHKLALRCTSIFATDPKRKSPRHMPRLCSYIFLPPIDIPPVSVPYPM